MSDIVKGQLKTKTFEMETDDKCLIMHQRKKTVAGFSCSAPKSDEHNDDDINSFFFQVDSGLDKVNDEI
jgi:hypothetical protein